MSKYIENKRFMDFLNQGHGEFGWTAEVLLNQIVSACALLEGGVEYPPMRDETRQLFFGMFRNSSQAFSNLWSTESIITAIVIRRNNGYLPEKTYQYLFESCRGVDGKRLGITDVVPI